MGRYLPNITALKRKEARESEDGGEREKGREERERERERENERESENMRETVDTHCGAKTASYFRAVLMIYHITLTFNTHVP